MGISVPFVLWSWAVDIFSLMYQAGPWSRNQNSARALLWSCWESPSISRMKVRLFFFFFLLYQLRSNVSYFLKLCLTCDSKSKNRKLSFNFCNCARGQRAFPPLLYISPVVNVQTGLPPAAGLLPDNWQRLGLCDTHRPDAAGTRTALTHDATRWQRTQ